MMGHTLTKGMEVTSSKMAKSNLDRGLLPLLLPSPLKTRGWLQSLKPQIYPQCGRLYKGECLAGSNEFLKCGKLRHYVKDYRSGGARPKDKVGKLKLPKGPTISMLFMVDKKLNRPRMLSPVC